MGYSGCLGASEMPYSAGLRRESIKSTSSASSIGLQSVHPTWFEDIAAPKDTTPHTQPRPQGQQPQPLHGPMHAPMDFFTHTLVLVTSPLIGVCSFWLFVSGFVCFFVSWFFAPPGFLDERDSA